METEITFLWYATVQIKLYQPNYISNASQLNTIWKSDVYIYCERCRHAAEGLSSMQGRRCAHSWACAYSGEVYYHSLQICLLLNSLKHWHWFKFWLVLFHFCAHRNSSVLRWQSSRCRSNVCGTQKRASLRNLSVRNSLWRIKKKKMMTTTTQHENSTNTSFVLWSSCSSTRTLMLELFSALLPLDFVITSLVLVSPQTWTCHYRVLPTEFQMDLIGDRWTIIFDTFSF